MKRILQFSLVLICFTSAIAFAQSTTPLNSSTLTAPALGLSADDQFGRSVDFIDDWAVVGAPGRGGSGAIYIYRKENGAWVEKFTLDNSSDTGTPAAYGTTVAISKDGSNDYFITVSDPGHTFSTDLGKVYVYKRNDASDTWDASFTVSGTGNFGTSLAMSSNRLVIGSPNSSYVAIHDLSAGTQLDIIAGVQPMSLAFHGPNLAIGDPSFNTGNGKVDIYTDIDTDDIWSEETPTTLNGASGSQLGYSIDLDGAGQTLLVGAPGTNNAYLFQSPTWTLVNPVGGFPTNGLAVTESSFGSKVSLDGTYALISTSSADNVVYAFELDSLGANNWGVVTKYQGAAGQNFGHSLALRGNQFLIGEYGDVTTTGEVYASNTYHRVDFFTGPSGTLVSDQVVIHGGDSAQATAPDTDNGGGGLEGFVQWEDASNTPIANSAAVTVTVTKSQRYSAEYNSPILTLAFNAGSGGTVSRSSAQIGSGGSAAGVTATAPAAHSFVNWTNSGGVIVSTDAALNITGLLADETYTANFALNASPQARSVPTLGPYGLVATIIGMMLIASRRRVGKRAHKA